MSEIQYIPILKYFSSVAECFIGQIWVLFLQKTELPSYYWWVKYKILTFKSIIGQDQILPIVLLCKFTYLHLQAYSTCRDEQVLQTMVSKCWKQRIQEGWISGCRWCVKREKVTWVTSHGSFASSHSLFH